MNRRSLFAPARLGALLTLTFGACSSDEEHEHAAPPATWSDASTHQDPSVAWGGSSTDAALERAAISDAEASSGAQPNRAADAGDTRIDAGPTHSVPEADAATPGADGYLLVAELAEGKEAIHAYSLPDLRHTGQIDGVRLGNHLGALALTDGRVITSDDKNQQIIAVRVDDAGRPAIVNRVAADLGSGAVWGCGDAALRYLAVASGREGTGPQVANIVALDDFTLTAFEIQPNVVDGATEELHPAIAGEPLHLFASVGAEIRAYPLAGILAGSVSAPVASVAIHPGSHGPVVSHSKGLLYIATQPGAGFDGLSTEPPFARARLIPWDVDGRSTGRNARPRLSADGRYIYGAVAQTSPEGAELWATREVDLHVVDLDTGLAHRTALTTGIVSKFQLSRRYALFANVAGTGDSAILVDVEPGSRTFQQVVARIELPRLSGGPVAGQANTGKEARGSAITPDGKWAFVSHGGEGKISVIDTTKKSVVATVTTPSALAGGGYLFAVQAGSAPFDTCTR